MPRLLDAEFLARLERLELRVRRLLAGERTGEAASARRGTGTSFRGHRGYSQGDDLRFIDWNAFLRLNELVVKEFDAEVQPKLTLLVDLSGSMTAGPAPKVDVAKSVAAALGWIVLARHGVVRVAGFPYGSLETMAVGRAAGAAFLARVEGLKSESTGDPMALLRTGWSDRRPPGITVVLSDFCDAACFEPILHGLRRRGEVVEALHLVASADATPPLNGRVELVDAETGRRVRADVTPSLLAAFRSAVEAHDAEVLRVVRSVGAGYHRLDATLDVETLVLETLRARALLR